MMKKSTILALLLLVSSSAMALTPWKKGAFETGQYRNLLVEMGYSQADVDAKLKEVFNDVFRGPNKVYFEVGDSMGYVSDVKNHDARTEGMSYGLMIAVQFGEKDIFGTASAKATSPGVVRPTAPAMHRVLPATANSISSLPSSSPPTAGATTRASTTRPRHSVSSTASSRRNTNQSLVRQASPASVLSRRDLRRCI